MLNRGHTFSGVAFLGMFLQLPLIALTTPLGKSKTATSKLIGNSIFWVSFTIFGQPFAALMYFYAWQVSLSFLVPSSPFRRVGLVQFSDTSAFL